jgi:catechol 2,3-dioxygenase-like lactoylglutathione lyase family enzyme
MAIIKVHHVGLVNGDLDHARHVLVDGFGLMVDEHRSPFPNGRPGYDDTTVLEFPIGEMCYEVARPNNPESEAARFLASTNGRGGIYYLSLASNDFANDVAAIIRRGGKLQGDWDGKGPVVLDPTTSLGLRIQITPDDDYFVHPYFKGNGAVTGMAHIGIAARDPEESRGFWGNILGLREDTIVRAGGGDWATRRAQDATDPNRRRGAADDPVFILEYPLGGTVIEISHPTTDDSGTARLVATRGPLGAVFHHTAPFAPDVHRFVEQARAAGLQQIGSIPPREVSVRATAWFHPSSVLGMLLEPWNRPPGEEHYHAQADHEGH